MYAGRLTSRARTASGLNTCRGDTPSAQPLPDIATRCLKCRPWRSASPVPYERLQPYSAMTGGDRQPWRSRRKAATCCTTATETSTSSPTDPSKPNAVPSPPAPSAVRPTSKAVNAIFTTPNGTRWRVRPYDNSDYAPIIELQTESFHTTNPVPFLNTFTYNNFRAEVVDALKQKTKYSDPCGFQLLVAEVVSEPSLDEPSAVAEAAAAATGPPSGRRGLVGVVEVSLMSAGEVLRVLPKPTSQYAYVSSMCVRTGQRRRGVAQALLAAVEAQALLWRQRNLALHVYKDNEPAVALYSRCGMQVVGEDPGWKAMLGGRVRLLMKKELPLGAEEEGEEDGRESDDGR